MVARIDSSLRLENDSEPLGEGWWKWSVWLEGTPEDLVGIDSVTYRLHPTFPKPVQRIDDASTKFRLSSAGWGEFAIAAEAHMKDGRAVRLERWLDLGKGGDVSGAERRPSVFLSYSITDSDVANVLREFLIAKGIDVRTADQAVESGEGFFPQINRQLQEADAVVALVSEPRSRFVEQEAVTAHKKGRFVLPIAMGGATVQGPLSALPRFELPDRRHAEALAQQIAARVMDHAIPEDDV